MTKLHTKIIAIMLLLSVVGILSNIKPSYAPTAKIYVNPADVIQTVGVNFTLNVTIADVTNLYGLEIQCSWDPTFLYYVSKSVKIPRDTNLEGILWSPTVKPIDTASRSAGTYRLVATSQAPAPSFNSTASDGTVFTITFRALREGAAYLHFTLTLLSDPNGDPISHTTQDGHVSTSAANRAPLANFTFSPDAIYMGRTIVNFDGSASYDPDGGILTKYLWDFGDGIKENTTTANVAHTYSSTGFFTAYLKVLDEENSYSPAFPNQKPLNVEKFCDIAVTKVTISPQRLEYGLNGTVNVDLRNSGDAIVTDAFVIAYFNQTPIDPGDLLATTWKQVGNQTIYRHPVINPWNPGENISLTFTWNTTGVPTEKYYWIMVNTTYTLPADHNLANNVRLSDGSTYVVFVSTVVQEFVVDSTPFMVSITSNSTVSNIAFSAAQRMISFNVTGADGTVGFARVAVPLNAMWGPWTVLVDDAAPLYSEQPTNTTHTIIYLAYDHSMHTVTLISTGIVPEFQYSSILAVALILATTAAIIGTKTKKTPKPKLRSRSSFPES